MYIKFAVKDKLSGHYMTSGGRGDRSLWLSLTEDIESACMYYSKGPATTFINQYTSNAHRPHTVNASNPPPQYDLVVVEVAIEYKELP